MCETLSSMVLRRSALPGNEKQNQEIDISPRCIMLNHIEYATRNLLCDILGVSLDKINVKRSVIAKDYIPKIKCGMAKDSYLSGGNACIEVQETSEGMVSYYIEQMPGFSREWKTFFEALHDVLNSFYRDMTLSWNDDQQSLIENSSSRLAQQIDWFIDNMKLNVVREYLYKLYPLDDYGNPERKYIHFSYDQIATIIQFSNELASRSIEGKPIFCGFAFHGEIENVHFNSVRSLQLARPIPFGSFSAIKSLLQASDGKQVFFNVTRGVIDSIFVTRDVVQEIAGDPAVERGKKFHRTPLIVSIQGYGRTTFLGGGMDINSILVQFINQQPRLVDHNFLRHRINSIVIRYCTSICQDHIYIFTNWILSLSLRKHGTTIIINKSDDLNHGIVKSTLIEANHGHPVFSLSDERDLCSHIKADLEFLYCLTQPDGALVFDCQLRVLHIGAILHVPEGVNGVQQGGARHNSAMAYTSMYGGVAFVVSEDGPITIIENGKFFVNA